MSTPSLTELNQMPAERFVSHLGSIFEHSPWVAEAIVHQRPFSSVAALHAAMVDQVEQAGHERQLALLCAHPELAGKAAVQGDLTAASASEQAGAGLDRCTQEEFDAITDLNHRYREAYGFPFILAVAGHDRSSVIAALRRRLGRSRDAEFAECLQQVYKIARHRLDDAIIDTSARAGSPVAGH